MTTARKLAPKPAFSAFLSHRYRSPDVNLFFYRLFSPRARVEFSVDRGVLATNVTRLERLLRDADCFIGIYPFPGEGRQQPDRKDLLRESRYFRLELDLAERARKPAIAFIDDRYGDVLAPSTAVHVCRFPISEVRDDVSSSREAIFTKAFRQFCDHVKAWRAFNLTGPADAGSRGRVAILLPPRDDGGAGYGTEEIGAIRDLISDKGLQPVILDWPPRLDARFARRLRELDWAILDLGPRSVAAGISAYLHGAFTPAMRLLQVRPGEPDTTAALLETLFGAIEVGYAKDIVRWDDRQCLLDGVAARLEAINARRERIATEEEAIHYFMSAALRKERIFLSYTGRDADRAAEIIAALKRRFQEVFDYRDGDTAIPPGTRWLNTVFERLAVAPIGIPLLSPAYLESGNCRHEAEQMVALADTGKMQVFPVKLEPGPLALPPWIEAIQYIRRWDHPDADALVSAISASFDGLRKIGGRRSDAANTFVRPI
jgi:hypothetical protein